MNKKPLSRITINEIVQDCGLNRNSFYYHFEDIYALFKWMLEQEAIDKAARVFFTNLSLAFFGALVIMGAQELRFSDVLFEVFSAIGTVGMTTGVTRELLPLSQMVIILLMY